ncbi:cytochrome C biogenesis protein CcdA [Streptomyces albidoflavus]|uniref:cytochrome c biogenesis CcdA family protein n=1 Tax=Streptomyces albidoflavus TaxID=1886 RepID=UPI000BAE5F0D|nr:cytochrome c biogenesis protein CcdA [Streptomyces albidoflavus]PAX84189.1 cytochrome C biogenesis protein CcdA [Streptomyces albidoflavus]PBO16309.1 cytochrome C biogenesis protein CcdA [Streptomyces albidoflavus]PBO23473.1 cytochrome C biogenesis protein CcdA [Streptomyces albidoflavus]PBO30664.1 cytochrome C biogenesis protein CcdA [Streptomyces albidoflavus]
MNGLLALAFAAGMIAPVNPCGFALLPAWIAHALGNASTSPLPVRLGRALRSGTALTIGFAGTLAAAGIIVSAGARALISAAPWLGLATGLLLLLLGLAMLSGRSLTLRLPGSPGRAAEGPPTAGRMVVFGIGYAAASLSCTFGVLLAVIAQAQATANYAGLLLVFAAYAAGSATVLLLIAVTTAAAGTALTRRITALARYGPRITAAVLVLTGAYLAWYWYPAATGSTTTVTSSGGLARFSATISTWIQAHSTFIAILAAIVVLAAGALALRHRFRSRSMGQTSPKNRHEEEEMRQPASATNPSDGHCC